MTTTGIIGIICGILLIISGITFLCTKKKTKSENKTKETIPSFWGFIWNKMWWWIPILILVKFSSQSTGDIGVEAGRYFGGIIIIIGVFIFWGFKYRKYYSKNK